MDWKKLGKKLLFPPVWLLLLLTPLCAAALIFVFVSGWENTAVAYITYALSFYTLTVVCVYCCVVLPKQYKQIKQKVYDNPWGNRYMTDRAFRTKVSLYLSQFINVLYALLMTAQFFLYRSWWFIVLAGYYLILSVMRFVLAWYIHGNEIGEHLLSEWKRARICACILLLVNLSLSSAILMILYQEHGYDYKGILIYVMAAYTFYITTNAVIQLIRHRKSGSPVIATAKVISLSAALVSMLNLETAMFAQFGEEMPKESQQLMIMLTGAGISIVIITLSVLLIVQANKEIRRERNGK